MTTQSCEAGLEVTIFKREKERDIVTLKLLEYGVFGDLTILCPKPYSIQLRETVSPVLAC